MSDYSKFIALANRLISKKGMVMKYLAVTEYGKIDPDTGKKPIKVEKYEFMGVRTAPTANELERGLFRGIRLVILAPGDIVDGADTTDVIQFDGHDYDIKEIVTVAPAETVVLYKFGVEDVGASARLRGRV